MQSTNAEGTPTATVMNTKIKSQLPHLIWHVQAVLLLILVNESSGYLKRAANQATVDRAVSGFARVRGRTRLKAMQ